MATDPIDIITSDLRYLVDELEALKYLIDVVPVYERPGNELSVCEHIRLIHFVQDKLVHYLQMKKEGVDFNKITLDQLIEEYKDQRSDIVQEQKKGVQHYINKLIQSRLGLLSSIDNNHFNIDEHATTLLRLLITLERAIFKEMAEKVLAINKDT